MELFDYRIFYLRNGSGDGNSSLIRVQVSFNDEMTRNQVVFVTKRAFEALKGKISPEKLVWLRNEEDTEVSLELVAVIIAEVIGTFIGLAWGIYSQFLELVTGS